MNSVNQKIIDAVIEKANRTCPESLALIGVYGSVATGDAYEKSDLDLLILVRDEAGKRLGTGFILDDTNVGYDIYCTDRQSLEHDAECHHARIAKLMDSQIVYVKDREAYADLLALRARAEQFLQSEERYCRVEELIGKAKITYANACLYDAPGQVRAEACAAVGCLLDAVMLYHGRYFKRGVKKTFEELAALPLEGAFLADVKQIAVSKDAFALRARLKRLILSAEAHTRREKPKALPSDALAGTYEEMVSNWRNKVEEAAQNKDAFASFVNMCGLHLMLGEISSEVEIGAFDVMGEYRADSLAENVTVFDRHLQSYEEVYRRAGIGVKRFANVDAFVVAYLDE